MIKTFFSPALSLLLALLEFASGEALTRSTHAAERSPYVKLVQPLPCTLGRCMNSVGSGTVIGANTRHSLILTCQHVVPNGSRCTVVVGDERYEGTVIKVDTGLDLALVTIPVLGLPGVPLERSTQVQPGDQLWAHSFPRGLSSVSERRVALRVSQTRLTIRDAWVDGQSGGAVLNAEGRLVGVILGNLRDGSGVTTAWPALVAFTQGVLTAGEPSQRAPLVISPPSTPPSSVDTTNVLALLQRIESRITALEQRPLVPGPPGPEGRPGRDGIEGKPGPAGAVGPAGRVDAASLLKQIPPITFELVDPEGRVLDRISAAPGGTVRLRLKPKQE